MCLSSTASQIKATGKKWKQLFLRNGGRYRSKYSTFEEILMCVCVRASAVSVSGVPLCGFLLPQRSPYLHSLSTGDKWVSEEINDFTISMLIFCVFRI